MKRFTFLFLSITIVVIFSCKKSDRDEDTSTNSSEDYATGQTITNDIFKLAFQAAYSAKGIANINLADTTSLFGCDTLIIDTTSSPNTIAIQFNGTCSSNGMDRTGTINISFNTKFDNIGATATVSFNNFTYNNYLITGGSIAIINNGMVNSKPNYALNTSNLMIQNSKQQNSTFSCFEIYSIEVGAATATVSDDTYAISGNASGRTLKGNTYTSNITTSLSSIGSCNWVSAGIVDIKPENKATRLLDFGSSCDQNATVTIYSINYDITLP